MADLTAAEVDATMFDPEEVGPRVPHTDFPDGDSQLRNNAQHIHAPPQEYDDAPLQPEAPEEDLPTALNSAKLELGNRLHQVGLDIYKEDFPDQNTHSDFRWNHRDLPAFWGVVLSKSLFQKDLDRRRRQALLVIHPDKMNTFPARLRPGLTQFATDMTQVINHTFELLSSRLDQIHANLLPSPKITPFTMPFQEIPEGLQLKLYRVYAPDVMICATSEGMHWCVGLHNDPPFHPSLDTSQTFLEELLWNDNSASLHDLLLGILPGRTFHPVMNSVMLVLQKVPGRWHEWLRDQLSDLRHQGIKLQLYVALFADAWPADWEVMKSYAYFPLTEPRNFQGYYMAKEYMEPPFLSVITAGSSSLRVMKKIQIITFTTTDAALGVNPDMLVQIPTIRWEDDVLPAFKASKKLYLDFQAADTIHVSALANQVAKKFGGCVCRDTGRSFGDSGKCRRRTLVICFPPSFDTTEPALYEQVNVSLREMNIYVLLGWENLYTLPPDALMLESNDDLVWTTQPHLYPHITQAIVVSKRAVIVELPPRATSQTFRRVLEEYNLHHEYEGFTMLRDSEGRKLWNQRGSRPPPSFLPHGIRPMDHDIVIQLENHDPSRFQELIATFLESASALLLQRHGFTENDLQYTAHFRQVKGRPLNRVLVTGFSMEAARSLYYRFREHFWSSDAQQHIRITLRAAKFEDEMARAPALRLRPKSLLSMNESRHVGTLLNFPTQHGAGGIDG